MKSQLTKGETCIWQKEEKKRAQSAKQREDRLQEKHVDVKKQRHVDRQLARKQQDDVPLHEDAGNPLQQ